MNSALYDLILIYCCVNLGAGLVSQLGIISANVPSFQPFGSLQGMFTGTVNNILGNWTTTPQGLTAIISGLGALIGLLVGNVLLAFGFLTLMALAILAPFILNILGGLPYMLAWFGVSQPVVNALSFICAFIACFFIIELISQRDWSR